MKIAFLSFYSGQIDRGIEVAVEELATRLAETHDMTVFQAGRRGLTENSANNYSTKTPPYKNSFSHKNSLRKVYRCIQLDVGAHWPDDTSGDFRRFFYLDYYSRKILLFTLKFLPYLYRNRYDVVIPTNAGWQALICRLVTVVLGKKMVVQGNAGMGRDDLWQLLCRPDHFIAISPQGFSWAKKRAKGVNISYIPYGVNLAQFKQAKPTVLSLKRPRVLCVAAFSPYKRIDLLIKAMAQVKNATLIIVGQGPLGKRLHDMGKNLLGSRFLFKTGVNHNQLIGYYKAAQVFSLPSATTEALGIVQIEAMAAGLPVVATDDENRREILGEAGIFVNPENTEEYAGAIEKALTSDFGAIPETQAGKFGWDKIVEQYEKLFINL